MTKKIVEERVSLCNNGLSSLLEEREVHELKFHFNRSNFKMEYTLKPTGEKVHIITNENTVIKKVLFSLKNFK